MTASALLTSWAIAHHPDEETGGRSFACPRPNCGGTAKLSRCFDDSGRWCLECQCTSDSPTGQRFFDDADQLARWLGVIGHREVTNVDLPRGTWADLDGILGPVRWDWDGWLARGFLHLLVAGVGVGKSSGALAVARSPLLAEPWPDGSTFDDIPGSICWCETEAGQALNLDRAKRWKLPLDRIVTPWPDPMQDVVLTDSAHKLRIAEAASDPDVHLVIVDSLSGGNRIDENSPAMGRVVQGLAEIARNTGKPVLAIHHVRKRKETDPDPRWGISIDQIRGHSSIVQSPRVIWGLDQPGGPTADVRRLHVIKNNLRAFPEPIGMVVDEDGLVTFGDAPEEPEITSACKDACDWLQRLLAKAPLPSAEVLSEAARQKIAPRTLYRAKAKLRVCSPKVNGVWFWSLPAVGREK